MIIATGSCNAETFAVNQNSDQPYRAGIQPDTQRRRRGADEGWLNYVSSPFHRVWNQRDRGDVVLWNYERDDREYNPYFWAVYNSDLSIRDFWESESDPDSSIDRGNMPIIYDSPHDTNPGGGGNLQILLPKFSVLESLETDVIATSLPSWITGTVYDIYPNTTLLLSYLFMEKQVKHRLIPYADISTLSQKLLESKLVRLYHILWLRSASQILYDHKGDTMIPLVLNKLQVNTTTLLLELI